MNIEFIPFACNRLNPIHLRLRCSLLKENVVNVWKWRFLALRALALTAIVCLLASEWASSSHGADWLLAVGGIILAGVLLLTLVLLRGTVCQVERLRRQIDTSDK
jgi:hypothetical protein